MSHAPEIVGIGARSNSNLHGVGNLSNIIGNAGNNSGSFVDGVMLAGAGGAGAGGTGSARRSGSINTNGMLNGVGGGGLNGVSNMEISNLQFKLGANGSEKIYSNDPNLAKESKEFSGNFEEFTQLLCAHPAYVWGNGNINMNLAAYNHTSSDNNNSDNNTPNPNSNTNGNNNNITSPASKQQQYQQRQQSPRMTRNSGGNIGRTSGYNI